jgi:hypothetical protein
MITPFVLRTVAFGVPMDCPSFCVQAGTNGLPVVLYQSVRLRLMTCPIRTVAFEPIFGGAIITLLSIFSQTPTKPAMAATTALPLASSTPPTLVAMPLEIRSELLLHLEPRHVYKLMRTSRALYQLCCTNKVYWERVAKHLLCRNLSDEMFLARGGYKRAMDAFLHMHGVGIEDAVMKHIEERDYPYCNKKQLAPIYREVLLPAVGDPGRLCRLIVEEVVTTRHVIENMRKEAQTRSALGLPQRLPAETGFVVGSRRAKRSSSKLIHSIIDEPSLDMACKRRIMESIRDFVNNITESRHSTTYMRDVIKTVQEDHTYFPDVPFFFTQTDG